MSRSHAMTLGEEAYNAYLFHLDPGYMNPRLPRWPEHLTQREMRHWHTAVGPSLRSSKPHYRLIYVDGIPCNPLGYTEILLKMSGKYVRCLFKRSYVSDDGSKIIVADMPDGISEIHDIVPHDARIPVLCDYISGAVLIHPK